MNFPSSGEAHGARLHPQRGAKKFSSTGALSAVPGDYSYLRSKAHPSFSLFGSCRFSGRVLLGTARTQCSRQRQMWALPKCQYRQAYGPIRPRNSALAIKTNSGFEQSWDKTISPMKRASSSASCRSSGCELWLHQGAWNREAFLGFGVPQTFCGITRLFVPCERANSWTVRADGSRGDSDREFFCGTVRSAQRTRRIADGSFLFERRVVISLRGEGAP